MLKSDAVLTQPDRFTVIALVVEVLRKVGAGMAEPMLAHFLQLREVLRGCKQLTRVLFRPEV